VVPSRLPRLAPSRALATVTLPLHLNWPEPGRSYDLRDRRQRARVYEIVLREGREPDLLAFVDGVLLIELWEELVLPADVRAVWAPDGFLLSGGAALAAQELISPRRATSTCSPERAARPVEAARDAFENAIGAQGWSVERIRDSESSAGWSCPGRRSCSSTWRWTRRLPPVLLPSRRARRGTSPGSDHRPVVAHFDDQPIIVSEARPIERHSVLGGLINEYRQAASARKSHRSPRQIEF